MTTNVLSVTSNDKSMVAYGFGAIVGSGVFDFSLCLGLTALYSRHYHGRDIPVAHESIMRSFYPYLCSVALLALICWDYEVTLFESVFLIATYPLYLYLTAQGQEYVEEEEETETMLPSEESMLPTVSRESRYSYLSLIDSLLPYQ